MVTFGDLYRRNDGRFVVVRELFDDGCFGCDVAQKPAAPAEDWVELSADDLAGLERLPNLYEWTPTGLSH